MKPRNLFGFGASFTPCPGVARKGGDGWQLSTPGARDSERRPRRSCVAAETGRGTAFALGFPIGGSLRCPCSIGNDIHTACGRYPALPDDIHACGVDDICEPMLANDEAPDSFESGASFTLAAIYSRGTCRPTTIDVLMFHFRVRNGTGWGHQAMTTRLLSYSLPRSSLLRNS